MMSTAASSPSSSALSPKKYDVFLSFRGEDTRRTFTSHLHTALRQSGIQTYIDYELPKGDDISDALKQAIEDSSIAVVIFSENYGSSKWCLNELTKILECKEVQGQLVVPVFYEVDPSHVRNQKGTYRETFAKHERDLGDNQDKIIINEWKRALFETASLAGWDSRIFRDESKFIQEIVNDVMQKISLRCPNILTDLVGIEENCLPIEMLLEKVPIIGIWGMGGIGKTTLAKALFTKLSSQFESCCFLENIREEVKKHGLAYIRDKLLFELLKGENSCHRLPTIDGSTFVKRRLSCTKVFIVLDDVSNLKQLEYLAAYCDCLGPGSKVIITTRDKQLLVGRVNEIYETWPLSCLKSAELFNLKAFNTYNPKSGYESLSKRVVDYAEGIPLVLVVLGLFLRSKTTKEWDSALAKLNKSPSEEILEVLKLSYDGLNYEEREMFLDIVFFLKGENKEDVIKLFESYGFHASIGLRVLEDSTLITIYGDIVWMHNLIQEMGYEIVRRECIKNPGRRSRLFDPNEVYSLLKNNTGTNVIEGIVLDLSQISHIHLSTDTFKKMTNLRFLKFYSPQHRRSCNVNLSFGLESLSDQLRFLQWDGYPLESLPSTFCPEKLVELCMQNSHLKKLWNGAQDFVNLRRINFAGSKQLIELPDLSKAHNLESINLSSCERLCCVHPSILSLHRLITLNLYKCKKLKTLHSESKSLRYLNINQCFNLTEFSLSSEEIAILNLETTGIKILDTSIGRLSKLEKLYLNGSTLKSLSINELCGLRSLQVLRLYSCKQVIDKLELHILFDALRFLREIYLDLCCNLTELPNNIKHLLGLKVLSLQDCESLKSLPELPPSIEVLDAINCTSLESLVPTSEIEISLLLEERMMVLTPHSSIGYLTKLRKLHLSVSRLKNFSIEQLCCLKSLKDLALLDCGKVIDDSKLHMLVDALCSLVQLYLGGCSNLYELPDNFNSLSSLKSLGLKGSNLEHLPSSIKHLSKLQKITLTNCRTLRSLPELPPFTKYVKATNCSSLEDVFNLTTCRPRRKYLLEFLFLENCLKLEEHSLSIIEEYAYFSLKRVAYLNRNGVVYYPGCKVPKWVRYSQIMKASRFITIEPCSTGNNLLGFIFCSVLPQFTSKENCQSYLCCHVRFEDGEQVKVEPVRILKDHMRITELNTHHVYLWYDPIYSECILREFKEGEDEQGTKGSPKLSFEFFVLSCNLKNHEITKHDGLIEACGVCPIYASEYHSFLQQIEFGLELGIQKKSDHDNDEHSLCRIMKYTSLSLERVYNNFERIDISDPESAFQEGFLIKTTNTRSSSFDLEYHGDLLGFIFIFVIPQFSMKEKDRSHSTCRHSWLYGYDFEERVPQIITLDGPRGWHYSMTKLNSDNVFQLYDPLFCEFIIANFRKAKVDEEGTRRYSSMLSFEFEFGDCLIKEWGLHPIYASEYNNFLQQKELKLELGMKTKRPRDTCDEEEQFTPTKKMKESSIVEPENIDELLLTLSELNLESANDSTLQK